MAHEFEVRDEIELDATPEQVWDAIATGPGIDSWFMGRSEIAPREGGSGSFTILGESSVNTTTAWEPGRRLAYRSEEAPDGTFMAFEYILEGRAGGSTVLRFVHNGFLDDDWEAEYDALTKGDGMYLRKLAAYLKHFKGRTSTFNVFAPGPQLEDKERVWAALRSALGLAATAPVAAGDAVRLSVDGLAPADGVVEFTDSSDFLAVRTDDSLIMFIHAMGGTVVEQHCYADGADADGKAAEEAWQAWLTRSFA